MFRKWVFLLLSVMMCFAVSPTYSIEEIQVIRSMFDAEGEVVGFCYDPPDWIWVDEADAILAIEQGLVNYYTNVGGFRANVIIKVVDGQKHIWTERDSSVENNLSSLQKCPDKPAIV